jgi:hypothetical protein
MGMVIHRFEVYLVNLDPTLGSEIKKLGPLDEDMAKELIAVLSEMFAE